MSRPVPLASLVVAILVAGGVAWVWRFEVEAALPLPLSFRDSRAVDEALLGVPLGDALAGDARPDVILVVLDTVRRDRVSLYGYPGNTMPALSAWARGARVFRGARSSSSWTLPAHGSLFTGLPAREHGAHGRPFDPDAPIGRDAHPLDRDVPTLAAQLSDAGYATVGIVANRAYLGPGYGLDRGFHAWMSTQLRTTEVAYPMANRVTDLALDVLSRPRGRPLFLFLNYMDAHTPMVVREGYTEHAEGIDAELLPTSGRWRKATRSYIEGKAPLDPAMAEGWSLAYDGELRFLDEHLGRLLHDSALHGIDEDDLVIVTSDHGELFGAHRLVAHSKDLYEALVRIPMIVRGPGFPSGWDDRPVQLQDVAPWVLGAAGISRREDSPEESLQVMELYWTRHKDLASEALRERFDRILHAFVDADRKLLQDDRGGERLYDLRTDPDEEQPLADAPWAPGLRAAAAEWLAAHPPARDEP